MSILDAGSLAVVREITDETFEAEVLQADKPVVIDFWAPWCGPCKAVEPVLADLAEKHAGRVEFAKLNIDENPLVASRYDVLSIPTAILFEGGEAREASSAPAPARTTRTPGRTGSALRSRLGDCSAEAGNATGS